MFVSWALLGVVYSLPDACWRVYTSAGRNVRERKDERRFLFIAQGSISSFGYHCRDCRCTLDRNHVMIEGKLTVCNAPKVLEDMLIFSGVEHACVSHSTHNLYGDKMKHRSGKWVRVPSVLVFTNRNGMSCYTCVVWIFLSVPYTISGSFPSSRYTNLPNLIILLLYVWLGCTGPLEEI